MKRWVVYLLFLSSAGSLYPQFPYFQWAHGSGSSGLEIGYSIVTDNTGNVYTAGVFEGTVDFDPGAGVFNLSATGGGDIFVTKHGPTGNFLWAKRIGGDYLASVRFMTGDASGNLFLTGSFYSTVDFDPGPGTFNVTSSGADDVFICKLDASGNFMFAKTFGGLASDGGESVCLDSVGNIYLTGTYLGTADFDPGIASYTLTSTASTYDLFVSKFDNAGNFVWARSVGGMGPPYGFDVGSSISVDPLGYVYVCGGFQGSGDFDPGPGVYNLTSAGEYDIYLGKLSPAGNFVWAIGIGGNASDEPATLFVKGSDIYMNGKFTGIVDFDPGPGISYLTTNGWEDIFVCKFDTSGALAWVKNMGGPGFDIALDMALDTALNIYSTGFFFTMADFDPGPGTYTLSPVGASDVYVSKLDASGNFEWAVSFGSTGEDKGWGIDTDANANVYTTGQFSATADFDPGLGTFTLGATGIADVFIHKLGQCTAPSAPINSTSVSNLTVCSGGPATLSAASPGTINWYATPSSTLSLGLGSIFTTPALTIGTYTYYAGAYTCTNSVRTPINVTADLCTKLEELIPLNAGPIIFPNPSNRDFQVQIPDPVTNGELILFNAAGQKVFEERIVQGANHLKTAGISPGFYTFVLLNNKQAISKGKLIIE